MEWIEYFCRHALLSSEKSKDRSTKCGAVIVNEKHSQVSTGFNGMPRGIIEKFDEGDYVVYTELHKLTYPTEAEIERRFEERPYKYKWFEHAERNAIYNAASMGVSTENTTMFITRQPCTDCARAIIQSGIIEVYIIDINDVGFKDRWNEDVQIAYDMLLEARVKYTFVDPITFQIISKESNDTK